VCEQLSELREALKEYSSRFDAAALPAVLASRAVEEASAIEHMASTIKGLAAARVAETEKWKNDGQRSPAHDLANRTGTSVADAQRQLDRAKRLAKHPKTEAAAKAGKLSPRQAAAITDAADADPEAEDALLGKAGDLSLRELEEEAARAKARVTDPEDRHKKVQQRRHVRTWDDREGGAHLHAYGTPETIAQMMGVLDPITDRLFRKARIEGRREPTEAYRFDALHEALCGGGEGKKTSGAAKVLIRVDLEALLRGRPAGEEVCEIAGYGPVPVSVVEELLARGETFWAAVITRGQAICGVAHLGGRPTAFQRSALEWLYPSCAREGCSARVVQWDHRVDWSKTHITVFDLLDGLCPHDHALKTREGWALVEGMGKRAFVPPDDPRHPKNANAPPKEAA
jgi:hypothetical protein